MSRTILHSDMNNFYASCECMENPSLRDKPIAVCGSQEERHGIVLAKSNKAKACGVTTGQAIWQAKQACPDLVVVEPHYELYMKYSKLAKKIYADYTDQVEPYGMDECWLDVTGSLAILGSGEKIANDIRERMKRELGLTVSVGVSFNKIFAKLGSDMKKPDAVTVISEDSFREKIWGLPASDMLGVGTQTKKKLDSRGIRTIGQIANSDERYLQSFLGSMGLLLWQYANGKDMSPVLSTEIVVPAKSVSRGTTTIRDLCINDEVWKVMLELCQDIGEALRTYEKKANTVQIFIRNKNLAVKQWQHKLSSPTQSASCLAREAFDRFRRSYLWEEPIRSVTVCATDLTAPHKPFQLDLFSDVRRIEKSEHLDTCVSDLRHRFGKEIIMPARLFGGELTRINETKIIMPTGMARA